MKKPSKENIENQRHLNQRALEEGKRQKIKTASNKRATERRRPVDNSERVTAPENFGILDAKQRDEVVEFIDVIERSLRNGKDIRISFLKTKKLLPQGFLYFLASIETLKIKFPERKITSGYPNDEAVEQMMQKVGLIQMMGLTPRKKINHHMVTDWHYYKGIDGTLENLKFIDIAEDIVRVVGTDDTELVTGISEAVTNTQDHAYEKTMIEKPWWLFTTVRDGKLSVVVCDLGFGIPVSLPRTIRERLGDAWLSAYKNLTKGGKKHSLIIKAALEYGRTRTKEQNRGKGLPQMLQVARDTPGGQFVVQSKRGYYRYEDGKETYFDYRSRIIGTVVSWQVPLPVVPA